MQRIIPLWGRTARTLLCVTAAVGCVSAALAEISDIVYSVVAENRSGRASFQAHFSEGSWDSERRIYSWRLSAPIELRDDDGDLIAILQQGSTLVRGDPQISLGYLVQAGDSLTNFTITSALLSFPTMNNPDARASASMGITDINGDGAELIGLHDGPAAYLAQYNGFVPGGSTFSALIGSIKASAGGSGSAFQNDPPSGYRTISGNVNDMSVQFKFSLTAFDTSSGTSNFEIVPEPAAVALLVLGALALLRRR
jgi:hypothetical protein